MAIRFSTGGALAGVVRQTTLTLNDGEHVEDISDALAGHMRRQEATIKSYDKKIKALQEELAMIKSRRSWDELELVTNETTGMHAVVRTTYRWEAVGMRLDFTDSMYRGMGY